MPIEVIDVEIFGRIIQVSCPKNYSSDLLVVANNLNNRLEKLKETTGVSNIEKLIFITALNVCYELKIEKKNHLSDLSVIEKKICTLNLILKDVIK